MEEEEELELKLSKLSTQDADYAATLDQLASLKLSTQPQEAQRLYKELQAVRSGQLKREACEAAGLQQPTSNAPPPARKPDEADAQQQGNGAPANQAPEGDDEWETKDWDQALESIRPPVPSSTFKHQEPPLPKTHVHRAADALAAAAKRNAAQAASRPGASNQPIEGSHEAQGEAEAPAGEDAAVSVEEQDPTEVITSWSGGFDHCVELGGLTSDIRTGDLQELLDSLLPGESVKPYIRWSDDNHAVLVCANVTSAKNLLEIGAKEGLVMRPFVDATQPSKQLPVSELLPPKDRPKTSTAVARRLMSHALGLPVLRDRAGEKDLAAARRQARDERRAKLKEAEESKAAAWGDDE